MKNISNNSKKKALLFAIFLLMIAVGANAQNYAFKVLATSGSVNFKANNKRVWSGTELQPTDEVVVAGGSYLGLMHKNGKTVEIRQAGTYKMAELSSKVSSGNTTVSAKYASYVAGEMQKADKQDINKNHKKYMAVTGAVQRATRSTAYALFLHEENGEQVTGVKLFNPKATFHFYGNPLNEVASNKTFLVRILSFRNVEFARMDVKGNERGEAVVDIDFSKYGNHNDFIVEVSVKDSKNKEADKDRSRYDVTIVKGGTEYDNVKAALAEMDNTESTALSKLLEAGIYEKEGFILDALTCYEKAIAMQPDVQTFQIAYEDFLARHRMRLVPAQAGSSKELVPVTFNPNVKEEDLLREANTNSEEPKKEDKSKKSNKKVK
jgi:hypothetical protein